MNTTTLLDLFRAADIKRPAAANDDLYSAAKSWWNALRPVDWSEAEHLNSPEVNCATAHDKKLALAVVKTISDATG